MKSKRKIIPLYCQRKKQPTLLQLLRTAAHQRRFKELTRNNKILAQALEESQCIAASNTLMLQNYAKDTNQILLARMKINEMAQTIQKLVSDLNDVARYLEVNTITTAFGNSEGPRTVSQATDLSRIDESSTSVLRQSTLEEPKMHESNSTESAESCPTLDSSITEACSIQQSPGVSIDSLGNEGSKLSCTPADKTENSPPTPQLNLISIVNSNITEAQKSGSPCFKNNTKQNECSTLLKSKDMGISKIPIYKPNFVSTILDNSNCPDIHNKENCSKTFVIPKTDSNPNIPSASLRRETYTLNEILNELSPIDRQKRRETFVIPALPAVPKTKPNQSTSFHPTSVELCVDEATIHLSEDMELTEVIPSSTISIASSLKQNKDVGIYTEKHCSPFTEINKDLLNEFLKPNLKVSEPKEAEIAKISESNKNDESETFKLTTHLASKFFQKSPIKQSNLDSQDKLTFSSNTVALIDNILSNITSDFAADYGKPTKKSFGRKSLKSNKRVSLGCKKNAKISITNDKTKDIDQTSFTPACSAEYFEDFYLSDSDEESEIESKPCKIHSRKSIKGLRAIEKNTSVEKNIHPVFQEQNLSRKSMKRRVSFANFNLTSEDDRNNQNEIPYENLIYPAKSTALHSPRKSILKKRISVFENNQCDKSKAFLVENSEIDKLLGCEISYEVPESVEKSINIVDRESTKTKIDNINPVAQTNPFPEPSVEESFLKSKLTFSGVSERSNKRKFTAEEDFFDAIDTVERRENFSLESKKDDGLEEHVKISLSNQPTKSLSFNCKDNIEAETVMKESIEIQQNEIEQTQPFEVENFVASNMIVEVEEENQMFPLKSVKNANKIKKSRRKTKSEKQRKTKSIKSFTATPNERKRKQSKNDLENTPKPLTENKISTNQQCSTPEISDLKISIEDNLLQKENFLNVEIGGRSRRARSVKSYEEPKLGTKMRR